MARRMVSLSMCAVKCGGGGGQVRSRRHDTRDDGNVSGTGRGVSNTVRIGCEEKKELRTAGLYDCGV